MIMLHIHRKKLQRKQVTLLYYDRRNAMGTENQCSFRENDNSGIFHKQIYFIIITRTRA